MWWLILGVPIERKVHGLFRWFILCGWGLSGFNPSAPLKLYDIDRICVMWYIPHNSTRIRLTKFRCPDRFHVVWPPHCPGPLDRTSPLLPWWPDMHVFLGILTEPCLQSPSITRRLFGSHFFPNPFECRAKLGVGGWELSGLFRTCAVPCMNVPEISSNSVG